MPKRCKFITEYLIPSLNSGRFGTHLQWLDKNNNIFQLGWCHKGDKHWSEGNTQVFVGWDKIKGHYQPNVKDYFSRSKQRFRALLYKLTLDGQLKEVKCNMKSKKVYCITGERKLRKKTQSLSTDPGEFSTDDMSSDENEMLSEDSSGNEMNEFSGATSMNNLDDHNYCKYLIDSSDLQDTRIEHQNEYLTLSPSTSDCIDPSKKVLVEQSYPYYQYDYSTFPMKEKSVTSDFSQISFEDLPTVSKNAVLRGNDGYVYGIDHSGGFNVNTTPSFNVITTPVMSTESFNGVNEDMNVQFEKFLTGLKMDDFSNLKNFWKEILSWP